MHGQKDHDGRRGKEHKSNEVQFGDDLADKSHAEGRFDSDVWNAEEEQKNSYDSSSGEVNVET